MRPIAVFPTVALVNVYDHAFAVDVLDPQTNQFAASPASRIQGHKNRACLKITGGLDQTSGLRGSTREGSGSVSSLGMVSSRVEIGASKRAERRNVGRQLD